MSTTQKSANQLNIEAYVADCRSGKLLDQISDRNPLSQVHDKFVKVLDISGEDWLVAAQDILDDEGAVSNLITAIRSGKLGKSSFLTALTVLGEASTFESIHLILGAGNSDDTTVAAAVEI